MKGDLCETRVYVKGVSERRVSVKGMEPPPGTDIKWLPQKWAACILQECIVVVQYYFLSQ